MINKLYLFTVKVHEKRFLFMKLHTSQIRGKIKDTNNFFKSIIHDINQIRPMPYPI